MKQRLKWIIMTLTVALALLALWQVRRVAENVRVAEEEKVRLWAAAIGQRARMVEATQAFFAEATLDEHRKMQMYTDILQSFNARDLNADPRFSLAYINYIVDSSHTPIIITSTRDSVISVPQELAGRKLEGALLEEYSQNPPFHYSVWGMPMTLYYKESQYYTQLREVLDGFTRSFLQDITQNSVQVPVLIVDSLRQRVLGSGNIDTSAYATAAGLAALLDEMQAANDPIAFSLPGGERAYVYYEKTPLLKSLRWLPLFYFFTAFVLIVVSYYLFRTTRSMEQNRIWVGLAKETAHQLGTPLSSLTGWVEYLKEKLKEESGQRSEASGQSGAAANDQQPTANFTLSSQLPSVLCDVENDLHRLETITHRFSKIGSVPELKDEDVHMVTQEAVDYLQSRSPRKVKFNMAFPDDEQFVAPLNGYLFQWVIENLCKNAIDAMEGAGTISIVASQDTRKIYIDVTDTGRGMSAAVQKRVFDSGFTTKSRGWGLGLTLARRIINQYHRGRLYVKWSVPGQGTTFRIVLRKGK